MKNKNKRQSKIQRDFDRSNALRENLKKRKRANIK
tara:strand:- start:4720 stop:4824 length:105 start_codon:yes stop_codon:yes gene_type:complete